MAAGFSKTLALHPGVVPVAGDQLDPEFQPHVNCVFPDDFMFQLSDAEFADLKSQIVISS